MASNLDQWEKDPFFSAAEEVQDSADRYYYQLLLFPCFSSMGFQEAFPLPSLTYDWKGFCFFCLCVCVCVVYVCFGRMESKYRRWIHRKGDAVDSSSDDLRRELQTTLGTTKWQVIFFIYIVYNFFWGANIGGNWGSF